MKRKKYLTILATIAAFLSYCSPVKSVALPEDAATIANPNVPVATKSVIQTAIRAPHGSPTPMPNTSDQNAKAVLTALMQTNGECRLPCLIGLFPGISGKPEISAFQSYFHQLASPLDLGGDSTGIMSRIEKDEGAVRIQFWKSDRTADISLDYYMDQGMLSQMVLTSWANQYFDYGARGLYDDPQYINILKYFSLASILDLYGPPSEILIAAFPDDPGYPSPPAQYSFSTVLVYSEKGFLMQYTSIRKEENESYYGCPQFSHVDVSTWNPRVNLSVSDAVRYFSGVDSINSETITFFHEIADVTEYTVKSFYEQFNSSQNTQCVYSPKSFWQAP